MKAYIRNVVLVALAVGALSIGALAAHATEPTPFDDGTKHCADFNATWTEFEVDEIGDGTFSDGVLSVDIVLDEGPHVFDWSSNIGVDAVFVKGSETAGNLYNYNPEATSDTGLHNPEHPDGPKAGEFFSINHVLFCYDVEASPSPSVSPTGAETSPEPGESEPGVTIAPTGAQTSPSVLGTKVLSASGASVLQLFLAGLMLVGLGVGSFAMASRADRRTG